MGEVKWEVKGAVRPEPTRKACKRANERTRAQQPGRLFLQLSPSNAPILQYGLMEQKWPVQPATAIKTTNKQIMKLAAPAKSNGSASDRKKRQKRTSRAGGDGSEEVGIRPEVSTRLVVPRSSKEAKMIGQEWNESGWENPGSVGRVQE